MNRSEETPQFEYPEEGPWRAIKRTPGSTTYYPRQTNRHARFEKVLPSGRTMIDDFHAGLALRLDYRGGFDWTSLKPKGRALGDRATMRRQSEGREWYVLSFQERYSDSDELESSELCLVEHYLGMELVRIEELPRAND